jgi:hypothetical protein
MELPKTVFRLLKDIARNMPSGRAIVLVPENQQLTTQAAYQKRRDAERKSALDRIAKEAFESGLYDRTGIPEGGQDE